jgi:RNA polymerase sigma-70 factor (ECF subfamily)
MTDDRPHPGLQLRDRQWFERLFREHHLQVLTDARRRLDGEADDIVSSVFTTAWQRRDDVPDDPLPWLYRTAANHILHARRGSARQARIAEAAAGAARSDLSGADFAAGADEKDLILRVLRDLPEADQEILRLWAWEHLDPAQLSVVLGCSVVTARVRLHRAVRRLRTRRDAADPESARTDSRPAPPAAAFPLSATIKD